MFIEREWKMERGGREGGSDRESGDKGTREKGGS
jgi:hypothetical protein